MQVHARFPCLVLWCAAVIPCQEPIPPKPAAPAVQVGTAQYQRQSSAVFFYHSTEQAFDVFGQCEVTYGTPKWDPGYAELLAKQQPGTRLRLGKDFWSTLDTNVDLTAGKVRVPAGIHYLALQVTGERELALVVMEASVVQKRRLYSGLTADTTTGVLVPLQSVPKPTEGRPVAEKLTVAWRKADAASQDVLLVLAFGDLEYTAKFVPTLDLTRPAK